jgi:hypothetical protein
MTSDAPPVVQRPSPMLAANSAARSPNADTTTGISKGGASYTLAFSTVK